MPCAVATASVAHPMTSMLLAPTADSCLNVVPVLAWLPTTVTFDAVWLAWLGTIDLKSDDQCTKSSPVHHLALGLGMLSLTASNDHVMSRSHAVESWRKATIFFVTDVGFNHSMSLVQKHQSERRGFNLEPILI